MRQIGDLQQIAYGMTEDDSGSQYDSEARTGKQERVLLLVEPDVDVIGETSCEPDGEEHDNGRTGDDCDERAQQTVEPVVLLVEKQSEENIVDALEAQRPEGRVPERVRLVPPTLCGEGEVRDDLYRDIAPGGGRGLGVASGLHQKGADAFTEERKRESGDDDGVDAGCAVDEEILDGKDTGPRDHTDYESREDKEDADRDMRQVTKALRRWKEEPKMADEDDHCSTEAKAVEKYGSTLRKASGFHEGYYNSVAE